MQKNAEPKQKKPSGERKCISSEVPKAECIRMCTHTPNFEWDVKQVCGKPILEQMNALVTRLMELRPEEREKAAMALLDVCGDKNFKIASLHAMKECGIAINLGMVAQKVFNGRGYEECVMILQNAKVAITENIRVKLREYCERKTLDNSLYSVVL